MKKTIYLLVMAVLCLNIRVIAQQLTELKGQVTGTSGKPLAGATIKIKSGTTIATTDQVGSFTIKTSANTGTLIVSFLGYETKEVSFDIKKAKYLTIILQESHNFLDQVSIVSTGYQNIPKERATGSFVLIDKNLLNRKVSTNILDRLDGVASGLIFNKNIPGGNSSAITIRGRSTIFANTAPLIVLDNFPYEGDINNINPNDVESISILKDAAAASIWGVRAGNGVIVITTKKGKLGKPNIKLNINTTFSKKPNLHYKPQLNSAEFIDLEQFLFQNGAFDSAIDNGYSSLSSALAIMLRKRKNQISEKDSTTLINQLKSLDIRDDLEKYIYRSAINQQYSVGVDGGSKNNTYYISTGYNKDLQNIVANSYSRFTLNASNIFTFLDDKLQFSTAILLTSSDTKGNTSSFITPYTPYDQLADKQGNHLSVVSEGGLRKQYTDTAGKGQLLDWSYRPLDENHSNSSTKLSDYLIKTGVKYKFAKGFNLILNYQYQKGINEYVQMYQSDSYYTRNLINSFTQLNQNTLVATRPIPLGAINSIANSNYYSHYGRAQINYNGKITDQQELNFLAGVEAKSYNSTSSSSTSYGYNPSTTSHIPVDYITNYIQYANGSTSQISEGTDQSFSIDRFRSAFINASYSYRNKYILSGSARRDESNIFGVKTNQKGVPLWSAGLMWRVSEEGFYKFDLIPSLKIRATYGYNGNLDRSTTAYLTARNLGINSWNANFSDIVNPPNPSLRWEKLKNINLGIDFTSKGNLISGSIEYYKKQGIDLIGNSPIAPQSGVIQFRGNSANTKTTGIDLAINKNVITTHAVSWQSNLLFSYNKEKITSYKVKQGSNLSIVNSNYVNPLEGYPYYAIFSFKFMGLDQNGNPKGILNGEISQNYSGINNSTDASELTYNGSATPLIYGSFRNSFSFNGFDLSVNLTYKFNYWFRRNDVFSGSNYSYLNADYNRRWQQSGDELHTNIPSLIYPLNSARDAFFRGSEVLVEKADHIRVQDIRISYNFKSPKITKVFKNLQLYVYANNIGIIWKATKQPLDPDYASAAFVNPRSFSIGLTSNF